LKRNNITVGETGAICLVGSRPESEEKHSKRKLRMNKDDLIELRRQLDLAIESNAADDYAILATSLAKALVRLEKPGSKVCARDDPFGQVLRAIEEAWFNGAVAPADLPGSQDEHLRQSGLISDILALQQFALSMCRGNLTDTVKIKGLMAGSLKALQANLRHLTWQTRMIAKGDLTQRVDFMGEFSESFNSMVESLSEAREQLKRHAEELARANADLRTEISKREETEKALEMTLSKLERSNAELQQFAYVASHDLQEPLRMIASYLQLIERRYKGQLDNDADDFIDFAVDGAKRMQALINDLLQVSRLGTREKSLAVIDCGMILQQALANLGALIDDSRAQVTHDRLPDITADVIQIVQLFQNLIGNAIKFRGKDDPLVHVSVQPGGAKWRFSVQDNGIGIDPQHAEKIFGVFQRLHGKGEYPGTGIGLAICRKVVEGHGGEIWVRSEPGKGATFFFTLPMNTPS
jgi:signal transduction histidine kinase